MSEAQGANARRLRETPRGAAMMGTAAARVPSNARRDQTFMERTAIIRSDLR